MMQQRLIVMLIILLLVLSGCCTSQECKELKEEAAGYDAEKNKIYKGMCLTACQTDYAEANINDSEVICKKECDIE